MDVKRRTLLKGITATAAVSMLSSRVVFASPIEEALVTLRETSASVLQQKPLTAVASKAFQHSAFIAGIQAAQPVATRVLDGVDYNLLTQLLAQRNTHLVGVVDHANAAILVQLSRHYDAKVHWLGQHAINAQGTAHNIFKSGNSTSCRTQLEHELSQCEATHVIREQGLEQRAISGSASDDHPQRWAAHLGLALSDISNASPDFSRIQLTAQNTPIQGSAVSFFIETC